MARIPKAEYSKIFERYIKGESLIDIHKDYANQIAVSALQLYASRHNWSKFKKSIKQELEKAQVYQDEKQNYADVVVSSMEQMTTAKHKRIEMTSNLLDMIGEYAKSENILAPKELATIASAFSVICDIQRTEFGEASIITHNHNLNANVSIEEKRKVVKNLKAQLAEYNQQKNTTLVV